MKVRSYTSTGLLGGLSNSGLFTTNYLVVTRTSILRYLLQNTNHNITKVIANPAALAGMVVYHGGNGEDPLAQFGRLSVNATVKSMGSK